jgi:hypothetical protein
VILSSGVGRNCVEFTVLSVFGGTTLPEKSFDGSLARLLDLSGNQPIDFLSSGLNDIG